MNKMQEQLARDLIQNVSDATDNANMLALMTGDEDYLLRLVVPDIQALESFILNYLTKIPGIKNIKSSFALL